MARSAQQVPRALLHLPNRLLQSQHRQQLHSPAWLWEPNLLRAQPKFHRGDTALARLPPLPPPVLNWLICTLTTFPEDLSYLCVPLQAKPLINILHTF
jgi:hypothetical protein